MSCQPLVLLEIPLILRIKSLYHKALSHLKIVHFAFTESVFSVHDFLRPHRFLKNDLGMLRDR